MASKLKCARWCGRGCTQEEYDRATMAAGRLSTRLGKQWRPHVWENLGWHYAAISSCGRFKVHPHAPGLIGFTAFLGEADSPGGRWVAHGKTPFSAVNAVLKQAQEDLAPWKDLL